MKIIKGWFDWTILWEYKLWLLSSNSDFDDLLIEYKQSLFTKLPIGSLTNNIVEWLKVSSIEWSLDNRIYKSNPLNDNFDDLPFDDDERLIARWRMYHITDNIIYRLKIVQEFIYKQTKCNKNEGLVWYIYQLTIEIMHDITERSKYQSLLLKCRLWS